MITNTGKDIIAKYLLGQAPAYASHLAIGCGTKPLNTTDSLAPYQAEFAQKQSMDFEMFRIPIISRGYVTELDTNTLTVSGATGNGTLITYTVTTAHGFAPGDVVDIAGTNISGYNISNAVVYSVPTSVTFTVKSVATGVWASGGTVTGRVTKLTLTAELPTEQRYEISEVGIYSSRSNPSATNKDSRMLYTFAETENWEYHGTSSAIGIGATITTPLSAGVAGGTINPNLGVAPAFRATSDNSIFDSDARLSRFERCRFLNTAIYVPGNTSQIVKSGTNLVVASDGTEDQNKNYAKHIHLAGTSLNLSQNSPEDELKLAFSVVSKSETHPLSPSKLYATIVFSPEESVTQDPENFARLQVEITSGLDANRYNIATSKLGELVKGTSFSWGAASLVRIYVSVFDNLTGDTRAYSNATQKATIVTVQDHGFAVGSKVTITGENNSFFNGTHVITDIVDSKTFKFAKTGIEDITSALSSATVEGPTSNYFMALDALRLENVSTLNPLYGLTGYTVIKTDDGRPIVKEANTSNLVEFRFGLDVM